MIDGVPNSLEYWGWISNEHKWFRGEIEVEDPNNTNEIVNHMNDELLDMVDSSVSHDGIDMVGLESLSLDDKHGNALVIKGTCNYDEEDYDTGDYRPAKSKVIAIVNVGLSPRRFATFRKFVKDMVTMGGFGLKAR